MFVYYYTHVAGTPGEAEGAILQILRDQPEAGGVAYREDGQVFARIGPDGALVGKRIRLQVGTPVRGPVERAIPITWEATPAERLFPKLSGELVLAKLRPGVAQLALRGTYRPPLGTVGALLDRAALHRIAEGTVKHFIDGLAEAIERRLALVPEPAVSEGGT